MRAGAKRKAKEAAGEHASSSGMGAGGSIPAGPSSGCIPAGIPSAACAPLGIAGLFDLTPAVPVIQKMPSVDSQDDAPDAATIEPDIPAWERFDGR